MKAWLKGGLIGIGFYIILFFLAGTTDFESIYNIVNFLFFPGGYLLKIIFSYLPYQLLFIGYLISVLSYFIIGAFIGWLISKFKK